MGNAVVFAIVKLLQAFEIVLIARVLVSWLPVSRDNKLIDLIYAITEPVLAPIRNMLSRSSMMRNSAFSMIDFSPVVAYFIIMFIRNALFRIF